MAALQGVFLVKVTRFNLMNIQVIIYSKTRIIDVLQEKTAQERRNATVPEESGYMQVSEYIYHGGILKKVNKVALWPVCG